MGEKTGIVKSYSKDKGYGFILADNTDYFFRWTDIISDSHKHCVRGEKVVFLPQKNVKGLRAVNVQKI